MLRSGSGGLMKRTISILAPFVLAVSALLQVGAASAQSVAAGEPRLILKGYDPVAYFTEQRPVKGAPEYQLDFDGARYHFSSARNRSTFNSDPDRYMPQFSGLCAMAIGKGNTYEGDPTAWKIIDGKLYVFASAKALAAAEKDPTIIARSREAWKARK